MKEKQIEQEIENQPPKSKIDQLKCRLVEVKEEEAPIWKNCDTTLIYGDQKAR